MFGNTLNTPSAGLILLCMLGISVAHVYTERPVLQLLEPFLT